MSGLNESASPTAVSGDAFDPEALVLPTVFDSKSEEALFLRYGRKTKAKQSLVFEFTRDPALIHQYLRIYHSECRIIPEFLDAEEGYNRESLIMIVRQGNLVVGGGRLFIVTPRIKKKMLLELAGFSLREYFPELEHKQLTYSEFSRLVVLPDFRGEDVLRNIFINMHRKSAAQGVDVIYAAAPLAYVRTYRKILNSIGLKEVKIHFTIDIPPDPGFEEVKDYLISAAIDKNEVAGDFRSSYEIDVPEDV